MGVDRRVLIPSSSGLKAGRFCLRALATCFVLIPSSSGLKAGLPQGAKARQSRDRLVSLNPFFIRSQGRTAKARQSRDRLVSLNPFFIRSQGRTAYRYMVGIATQVLIPSSSGLKAGLLGRGRATAHLTCLNPFFIRSQGRTSMADAGIF